jgi:hypothetical protein
LPDTRDSGTVVSTLSILAQRPPGQLFRTLTWDCGTEMAQHRSFTVASNCAVFFADPHSPWQRGSNENTNGLLRQYFPKNRTDFRSLSQAQLDEVATELNQRPRQTLSWQTRQRARGTGASRRPRVGPLTLRVDSGFWSAKVLASCRRHNLRFSITVRQTPTVTEAIVTIGEHAWTDIDYPDGGQAQVAETTLGADRLVVRRTRLLGEQATLWPDWRYHAFVTHRPSRQRDRAGRRPSPSRCLRACHPRPQRRRRAAPLPLRELPGQRRLHPEHPTMRHGAVASGRVSANEKLRRMHRMA